MVEIPESTDTTIQKIYRTYEDQPDTERDYLGCSSFGTECDRALWYKFRMANAKEKFSGRMLRLFDTGHREEERLITDLRMAGCEVFQHDEITGNQFAVSTLGGHVRGHLDGVVRGLVEAPKTPHVLETKTHNDRSYRELLKQGVKKSKPGHFAQMQLYMGMMKLDRAYYLSQNKNDDSLYAERIHFDRVEYNRLVERARRIITSDRAPPRISEDPDHYLCNWCPSKKVCHEGAMPRTGCRTCISSTAVLEGEGPGVWYCEHWKHALDLIDQQAGCPVHVFLPSLIDGEQIDADEAARSVTYRMRDGSIWVDGGNINA